MAIEANCGSEHYLGFDNFVIWEQLKLLCIQLQPVIAEEHKAVNATWTANSHRGREEIVIFVDKAFN